MVRLSLILFAVAVAAPARADEDAEKARAHVKAAIDYYDQARYEEAAREMTAGYALKPLPDLQYNLAQCYERLGKLPQAIESYRIYVAGKPDAPDRAQVEERILNLGERVKRGETGAPPPPQEKIVFKTVVVYKEAPPKPGRVARWAAYGTWVVAAAGLAVGIAFAILAKQAADDVSRSGNVAMPPPFDGAIRATQDRGAIDPIISGVGFGVAALAAGGGIALYLFARKIDRETPKLATGWRAPLLAPELGPHGGGLVASWRF